MYMNEFFYVHIDVVIALFQRDSFRLYHQPSSKFQPIALVPRATDTPN